jgi:hypothetical protein
MIDLMGYMESIRRLMNREDEQPSEGAVACHLGPGPHSALPLAQMSFHWCPPEGTFEEKKIVRFREFFSRIKGLRKTA